MYAIIQENKVIEWPIINLRSRFPNISFPAVLSGAVLPPGVVEVIPSPHPQYDSMTQELKTGYPTLVGEQWIQTYKIVDLPADQVAANQQAAAQALQDSIVAATQARLDTFARTRNYDSILSACSYSTDPNPRFAAEGQYCVEARSATWTTLFQVLAEVESGTRPMLTGYADIEPLLPELCWPN